MVKSHLVGSLIFVCTVLEPAQAKTLKEWENCMAAASSGREAEQIGREAGPEGMFEHALKVCGSRPTVGHKRLAEEDCDQLLQMSSEQDCELGGLDAASVLGNRFLKSLDPDAYNEDRYRALCQQIKANVPIGRQQFGREVCGEEGEAITQKNWMNHSEIVEIRSLYQKTKNARDAGSLKTKQKQFIYCEPHEDLIRIIYMDNKGKPVIYSYEGGSDDSTVRREIYYDANGKPRFALVTATADNGTRLEHRVYFSKVGTKIWEIQNRLEGPGYTFPSQWPNTDFVHDPVEAFDGTSPCPETK